MGPILNSPFGSPKPTSDIETFYKNWSSTGQAQENIASFSDFFFNTNDYSRVYEAVQQMSNYILMYYFFIQKDQNSVLPRIVLQNSPGYYQQTNCLYTFFRDSFARGMANPIIKNICDQNLSQFIDIEDKRRYVFHIYFIFLPTKAISPIISAISKC